MKRPPVLLLAFAAAGAFCTLLAVAACSPVALINATVPTGSYALTPNVAYGARHREQLDIYTPKSAAPVGGWPLVVFFYGGSWNTGERADYKFMGAALASRGIVTLVADYRLYPEVRYPDFLADCAQAVGWGMEHAESLGANPRRVFVMGHSAGAYNAAMLALDRRWLGATGHSPEQLAGWIGLAGPYDFYPIANPDVKPVFNHPNYPTRSQPIDDVTSLSPPSFVAAPYHDDLVNPERNSVALARRLAKAGAPVNLTLYRNVSHTTLIGAFAPPLRWLAPIRDDVLVFIKTH